MSTGSDVVETLREIMLDLARKNDFYSRVLVVALEKEWENVVGESLARCSWIEDFVHGILYVGVSDPMWLHELRLHIGEIVHTINDRLGYPIVKKVVMRRRSGYVERR